ncbi:MAG TPA: transglycosylase domain-containing protein [Acidimicrobiales bacterium]|nr:transglycosylase domain-containing protein [Acidimicrobiales bacterium]
MASSPRRLAQAVTVFVVAAVIAPVVTAGSALGSLLFLPLPTPPLPTPKSSAGSQVTHIYDAKGNEIGVLRQFDTNIPVKITDIPEVLKQAVVAQEDQRFYSHGGVDFKAGVRALWANLTGGKTVQGGSTITQQYVKNAFTGGERTFARKLREAVLATRLDKKLTKDEILYRYLQNVYLGGGAYGVGAAAESYFKKPVQDLTLSEAALLAGLIRSPSTDEPRSATVRAEADREGVLTKMHDQHRISDAQFTDAMAQRVVAIGAGRPAPAGPATVIYPPEYQSPTVPFYVDYVRRYLVARYGEDLVYRGGLRVETALDPTLQAEAEASVSDALSGTKPPLEMALVTVEPATGLVKAMVGGRDFSASQVNLALGDCPPTTTAPPADSPICVAGGGTGRQAGSAFKPFTLAKAFEEGIGPGRVYSGPSTYTYPHCSGDGCTVHNAETGGFGAITLREATAESVNTVFAQLINDVGIQKTAEMANRMGITTINPDGKQPSGEPYGASLTLGAYEVSPLDMAAASSVFANRGVRQVATPLVRVLDANGKVLEDNATHKGKRVLDQAVADNVNDVLKGVVTGGTGTAAAIGRPGATAGKTGTTESFGDAWFVGYTQALSTSVWMGYADSRRPLEGIKGVPRVYGGTIPAQTWHNFMIKALENVDTPDFPAPGPLPSDPSGGLGPGPQRVPPDPVTGPFMVVGPPITPAPTTTVPTPAPDRTVPTLLPPITLPSFPTTITPTTIKARPR